MIKAGLECIDEGILSWKHMKVVVHQNEDSNHVFYARMVERFGEH
jgi:hypothetical protein